MPSPLAAPPVKPPKEAWETMDEYMGWSTYSGPKGSAPPREQYGPHDHGKTKPMGETLNKAENEETYLISEGGVCQQRGTRRLASHK